MTVVAEPTDTRMPSAEDMLALMQADADVPMLFNVDAMATWLKQQRKLNAFTFMTAVQRVGRVHGPYLLAEAVMAGAFELAEGPFTWHDPVLAPVARATAEVWSNCDEPSTLLAAENWKALFDMGGYTVDGRFAEPPVAPLRLYRGATEGGDHGMAWTSSLETAKFFATEHARRAGDGKIWTGVFMPEHLLAHISFRNEHEYVVDPEVLDVDGWETVEIEEYDPAKHGTK